MASGFPTGLTLLVANTRSAVVSPQRTALAAALDVRLWLFCQIAPRLCDGDQPRSFLVILRSLSETKAPCAVSS
jgi:hypothetical protein